MPEYRLYRIGGDGHFSKVHEIDATDDGEALAKARDLKIPVECELWERGRIVATLAAHEG